ncbi:MAG: cobyrinate a,c-diamide synthase [Actinomycetota bacterium]
MPRIVIAGAASGAGKTTITVGLLAAFARRGLRVAPFKVGPDYIDPGWHTAACGRPSAPLDSWILRDDGVRASFARGAADADLAIIEGMMGLHDGAAADSDQGSTAEVAKLLQSPVILVLNAEALARSAGAMALGYRAFDPEVWLAGVVANRVAGESHGELLRPGLARGAGLPYLGWLPVSATAAIPERHLGLNTADGRDPGLISHLANLVESHLDLDQILEIARAAPELPAVATPVIGSVPPSVRIGLALDGAFCFYYPDNLGLLEAAGAELVPFSPIRDRGLPGRLDGVYLGGGYPELHAEALASNGEMRKEIRDWSQSGRPLFAECGGFMYLCDALTTIAGVTHPMAGVISARTVMEPRLQAIGYRDAVALHDSLLVPAGASVRGHEFRYSRLEGAIADERAAFRVGDRTVGYAHGGVLASYVHLHFGSNPAAAEHLVKQCLATH